MTNLAAQPGHITNPTANPIDVLRTIKSNDFAQSLVAQFDKRGSLSDKQWFWVNKLADEVTNPTPVVNAASVDLKPVVDLMHRAKTNLKFPKLTFVTATGQTVAIKVLGPKSRTPGAIRIDDGGGWQQDRWFGNITVDGKFDAANNCPADVIDLLEKIAPNPAKAIAENGKSTGHCLKCHAPLTDPKSKTAGMGKTCAKNFGIEWGAVADLA